MLKRQKSKIIDDVEHFGNIPKPQGSLLWYVDKCPFWLAFVILFIFIAIEMFIFAGLYYILSGTSFNDSLNYSLFSVLGQTVAESVRHSLLINRIISFQSIFTNCVISFFMAVILYKLINIKPVLIKMEDHVVFDPTVGILRLRITNSSRFTLTNVHIDATFRIRIPKSGRHANGKLQLKVENINYLKPYSIWNIATEPFLVEKGEGEELDISHYDNKRTWKFRPDLLNEEYRSDDKEKAKSNDYNNLNVILTIKSPLFGTDWTYFKGFSAKDFVCGKLIGIDAEVSGKDFKDWSKWGQYKDYSEIYCKECVYQNCCGIINMGQRNKTIN